MTLMALMNGIGRLATSILLAHAIALGAVTVASTAAAEDQGLDPATEDFITEHYGLDDQASPASNAAEQKTQQQQKTGDITVGAIVEALTRPAVQDTNVAYQRPHVDLDIKFEFDSAELTDSGKQDLDIAAEALQHAQLRSSRFMLAGHTDSMGDPAHNEALALQRAEATRDYLVEERGIDAARLETVGFGARKPRVEADTPEARRTNRRVVIELLQ
jgi:outer membrane protein OmpA-like peptidoglycan-associated protein